MRLFFAICLALTVRTRLRRLAADCDTGFRIDQPLDDGFAVALHVDVYLDHGLSLTDTRLDETENPLAQNLGVITASRVAAVLFASGNESPVGPVDDRDQFRRHSGHR